MLAVDIEGGNGSPLAHGQTPAILDPLDVVKPVESAAALKAKKLSSAVIFGIINGIVGIPTMISFATIIYKARDCHGDPASCNSVYGQTIYAHSNYHWIVCVWMKMYCNQ